jgi:hypothetical protein
LCFELFGGAAAAGGNLVRSDGAALRPLNCDDAVDPVNFGNFS